MVERAKIIAALSAAQNAGCAFSVNIPAPMGGMTVTLTAEALAACILDQVNLPAMVTGLTPAEYGEWIEQGGHVRCCATTKSGAQCRNSASRMSLIDPAEWKAVLDSKPYCPTHGG
ncbi:hypothetical protein MW7_007245 [Imbroritus primus]|uniref:Uncharacterized protein n=1 Tax=Imbroritus primus TaxID=3058603 RepID=A0ACD3SQR4_9BURK|nr:hypothetical protein MW7_007245 [Burkholderiaceae bacterium PBA]